jgi:geranylgeranyl pyrophosphate synthase
MTTTIEGTQLTTRMLELVDGLDEPLRTPVRSLAARPGKHLRATLVRTCAGPGGDPRRVLDLGALVELLHLASLLHDDVVDHADLRRGRPTARAVVGDERATLAGLACFALAGMLAADLGGGLDVLTGRTVAALAYGEMLDVERAFDTTLPIDDYLELAERKTGDLFRLSCLLGAVEAGRGASDVTALSSYGAGLGVAFQILDDCLDFGSAASGKPLGTDHLLGLFGAPTLFALAADSTGELAALLLAPGFAVDDMPTVRRLVVALGGLDQATDLAHATYDRAVGHLAPLDPELSAALTALWQVRS